ncbi:hypothetical protein [Microbacterium sp. LWH3-1.2]|uniref:hypothetical protein n=1 Tax=Microbacterium sp. LWH3-1.2 TaxID=3135256 RepID=UPI00342E908E
MSTDDRDYRTTDPRRTDGDLARVVAAVPGGMAGRSHHRRVDRVGLDGVARADLTQY